MGLELTYDPIAKRIDHSLLGPTLTDAELEEGCRLAAEVRGGQRLHQALCRRRWRRDPRRDAASRSGRRSASPTAATPRR